MKYYVLIIWCLLITCQNASALTVTEPKGTDKFLSIADIHFTPFTSCKILHLKPCDLISDLIKADAKDWKSIFEKSANHDISHYGQDTNYFLLKSSLVAIHQMMPKEKPKFTLVLGDFLGHNYREEYILYSHDRTRAGFSRFVKKTLQFLTLEIREAIPEGDIYPAIGNNDSYTGDYSVVPHGEFLGDTEKTWSLFINDPNNLKSFQKQFPVGGYYAVTSPANKNLRILILDTVIFTSRIPVDKNQPAAEQQLQWLTDQLTQATKLNQHVILAFHIPFGVDVYRTIQNVFGGINEFWQPQFNAAFQKRLQQFPGRVIAILPGHIHMDTFQMMSFSKVDDVPVTYTPSISPIFGNNPAFKIYSYDSETQQIKNFETYYFPLNDMTKGWLQEYSFRSAYLSSCIDCDLKKMMKQLTTQLTMTDTYKKLYAVGKEAQPIKEKSNWQHYWCNIQTVNANDFQACMKA